MGAILAERGVSKQGELGISHMEIHTSQWTGSVIQVTRMGLGFGAVGSLKDWKLGGNLVLELLETGQNPRPLSWGPLNP